MPGSSGSSGIGRPRAAYSEVAEGTYSYGLNHMLLAGHTPYSSNKIVLNCPCGHEKHKCYVAADTAQRNSKIKCRACAGKGSSLEQLAYELLNNMPEIQHFAMEACALSGQPTVCTASGEWVHVSRHRADVITLTPANLLIEVQGQQHSGKPMAYTNSTSEHASSITERDGLLAAVARSVGFTTVWLMAGEEFDRAARWSRVLRQAVQHVMANRPPHHFQG